MCSKIVTESVAAIGDKVESWGKELKAKELLWEKEGVLKQKQALMSFLDRLFAKVTWSMPESMDRVFYDNKKQYINKFTKIFESKLKFSLGKEAKYLKNLLSTIPEKEKNKLISKFAEVCRYNYGKGMNGVSRMMFAGYYVRDFVVKMESLELKYPKISPPKTASTTRTKEYLKKLFRKKGRPTEGAAAENIIFQSLKKVGKMLKKAGRWVVKKKTGI